jgi:hypothetical protein
VNRLVAPAPAAHKDTLPCTTSETDRQSKTVSTAEKFTNTSIELRNRLVPHNHRKVHCIKPMPNWHLNSNVVHWFDNSGGVLWYEEQGFELN